MRVAYLLAEFPNLSETFILREIGELRRQGVEVCLFALRPGKGPYPPEAAALQAEVCYRPPLLSRATVTSLAWVLRRCPERFLWGMGLIGRASWRRPKLLRQRLRNLFSAAFFAPRIAAWGCPLLHAHFAFIPTLLAMLIADWLKVPFTFSAHAWDIFAETSLLREKIARAARVITCNDYSRRHLETTYPEVAPGKVVRLYHGLEPFWFAVPNQRAPQNVPELLAVGRLQEKKGFHVLLEACARLRERGTAFHCTLVGDGPERNRLQHLRAKYVLTKQVTFAGPRPLSEMPDFYARADVVVQPSLVTATGDRDGLPNAILEALACGKPVVTTPVAAIPEVIVDRETGLLVPPGDASALAQAVQRLLANPEEARRLGERGRAQVREQFDLRRNVAALREVFAAEIAAEQN